MTNINDDPPPLKIVINGKGFRAGTNDDRAAFVAGVVAALSQFDRATQLRMIEQFTGADLDCGQRIAEGLGLRAKRS